MQPPPTEVADAPRRHGFAGALLAVIAWGASFVLTRMALESFSPFALVAVRLVIGVVLLVGIVRWRGGTLVPQRRDVPICVVLGLILAGHLSIQAYGLRYTSAINTGWIIGFMPVTIAVSSHLLGKQRIRPAGWLGTVTGTAGVLLVTASAPPDFSHARWGDLLQMCSCLTWTAYTVLGDGPVRRNGSFPVTTLAMFVAVLVLVPAALVESSAAAFGSQVPGSLSDGSASAAALHPGTAMTIKAMAATAFLGVVCSGLAFYWWNRAVADYGPARVGSLLYIEPFVTLLASMVLLRDEAITWSAILGGLYVLAGVWLVARGAGRK